MTRTIPWLLLLTTLAATFSSCRPGESEPPSTPAPEQTEPTAAEPSPPASSEEVAYEPAYPADVSSEGLSEEDVAQQEADHSHDGGEHSHDGGDHTHDEDDGHQH